MSGRRYSLKNMAGGEVSGMGSTTPMWGQLNTSSLKLGKDGGGGALGPMPSYSNCIVAEYVWVDAVGTCRSKTKTLSAKPTSPDDLPVWNFDGSSTGQAPGHDSEVLLVPRCIFKDPFRRGDNIMVLAECITPEMKPAKNSNRGKCAEIMNKYAALDPWFGIEQEYTLMQVEKIGEPSQTPAGFNRDGSEPAPQGPYYCGAGAGVGIGRVVAERHYADCLYAGIKIAGVNSEVMPGQWEYQIGPCRGIEMGDHLTMSRYVMQRVSEDVGTAVSFHPKPRQGDWNGAGCHTNFSVAPMRAQGGYDVIVKVCEAFGKVAKEHIAEYGEDNDKRLTGNHETCSINEFKYGVADRGASIRIGRETARDGKGYMEDRRPAANCDPYKVTYIMMKTTGDCLQG